MFDPTQPANNSALSSAVMRSQLTSLKALIDAVPAGPPGPEGQPGAPGAPFAQAVVDAVNTLNPGESAWVTVSFDGTNVHFSYGIPRGTEGLPGAAGQNGADGQPGPQGPPGEVTTSQLSSAIATTAQNPSVLSPMSIPFSDPPTQAELLQVQDKYNELLSALLRTP